MEYLHIRRCRRAGDKTQRSEYLSPDTILLSIYPTLPNQAVDYYHIDIDGELKLLERGFNTMEKEDSVRGPPDAPPLHSPPARGPRRLACW